MASRAQDWISQARRDLEHARHEVGGMDLTMGNPPTTTPNATASKPSAVQRRSCGSVRIAWLDRERAVAELRERAGCLLAQDARVIAVGLFGLLARREALPSSDADVLIALRAHPEARWFDRIPEYAAAFDGTSLPVEQFPYTAQELTALLSRPGFLRAGLRELIPLAGDERIWKELLQVSIRGNQGSTPVSGNSK